ncbi:MAG: hypothetical protein ACHQ1D_03845 [Nitrososphaerales archaeon]
MVAQDTVTIDWEKKTIDKDKIDINRNFNIDFKNCDKIKNKTIVYQIVPAGIPKPKVETECIGFEVKSKDYFNSDTYEVIIEFMLKFNQVGDSLKFYLNIKNDGEITFQEDNKIKSIPVHSITPFEEDFILIQFEGEFGSQDTCCLFPTIKYDPCCNKFQVWSFLKYKGNYKSCEERISYKRGLKANIKCDTMPIKEEKLTTKKVGMNYLYFYKKPMLNKGVVFLIEDFNMMKYDITLSNTYHSNSISEPPLFTGLHEALSSGLAIGASAGESIADSLHIEMNIMLGKLLKLNDQLQKFMTYYEEGPDCTLNEKYEQQKMTLLQNIKKHINVQNPLTDIEGEYIDLKVKYINSIRQDGQYFDDSIFNASYKIALGGKYTPDTMIMIITNNLFKIMNIKFRYQYNIPQIRDCDKLIFKLNIKPKTEGNGSIYVHNQEIEIPIYRGWRMDFTSGFYYSSVRNESYGLRPVYMNDTIVAKEIIENVDISSSTFGATAQMHLYRRIPGIQPTFNFGVGIGLNLNYSILLGAGIMIGENNRFALSGGFNFANIKVLPTQYKEGDSFIIQPASIDELDYANSIKVGGFIALTYKLSGPKEMTVAQDDPPTIPLDPPEDSESGSSTEGKEGTEGEKD